MFYSIRNNINIYSSSYKYKYSANIILAFKSIDIKFTLNSTIYVP